MDRTIIFCRTCNHWFCERHWFSGIRILEAFKQAARGRKDRCCGPAEAA